MYQEENFEFQFCATKAEHIGLNRSGLEKPKYISNDITNTSSLKESQFIKISLSILLDNIRELLLIL